MPHLRVRPRGTHGLVTEVTPESAGWTYVGFALHRLDAGEDRRRRNGDARGLSGARLGQGQARDRRQGFRRDRRAYEPVRRSLPGPLMRRPAALFRRRATTPLVLGVCSAPGGGGYPAKLIAPGAHPQIARGKGSNTRYVTNIMPEDDGSANALLVVEVITPGGNTSSYPPHKHDQDDVPTESYLEETYYHRFNPPQGYGFQRVYTDDRSLDEAASSRTATW